MERSELDTKYTRIAPEDAAEEWEAAHAATLGACMHGAHCVQGPSCQIGKRQIEGERGAAASPGQLRCGAACSARLPSYARTRRVR
jgi:hypothetical protein